MNREMRRQAYGEDRPLSWVDRFGVWLSARGIRRFVPDFRGLAVADLGCGYKASFFRRIQGDVAAAWLVDVSLDPALKELPGTTCFEGDLLEGASAIPDSSVDVVMCISVLEHVWKPAEVLAHIHRMLKPGGTCLLNVPTWLGKRFLEFSAFRVGLSPAEEMDDHKMYYGSRELWPLLVQAGFRPSRIRLIHHKFGLNLFAACRK
jgi:SAM-dependent methyltransferase